MAEAQIQTTRIRPMWLIKVVIGLLVCIGFAIWSAYDAFWLYPSKQRNYIEHTELLYLDLLQKERFALTPATASVPDPAQTKDQLLTLRDEGRATPVDVARLEWLNAISILYPLDEITRQNAEAAAPDSNAPDPKRTATLYNDPNKRLRDLVAARSGLGNATGLAAYDIPLQYLFLVASAALSIWLISLLLRVVLRRYRYEQDSLTLTTPEGHSFTPDRIVDVDRRKWDKFILFVRLDGEEQERRFDLYRYLPLEDWLLAMEKASPHVEAPPDEPADDSTNHDAPAQPQNTTAG